MAGIYDRIAMPTSPEALAEMLRWAHRRGYAAAVRSRDGAAPPRGVGHCDRHDAYDPACHTCIEADAYCAHSHIGAHPDAPVGASCWRPRLADEPDHTDGDHAAA